MERRPRHMTGTRLRLMSLYNHLCSSVPVPTNTQRSCDVHGTSTRRLNFLNAGSNRGSAAFGHSRHHNSVHSKLAERRSVLHTIFVTHVGQESVIGTTDRFAIPSIHSDKAFSRTAFKEDLRRAAHQSRGSGYTLGVPPNCPVVLQSAIPQTPRLSMASERRKELSI